mmetsp:Transcript_6850/g.17048  ORF Transcript_6850/g.17048 Transcript_6850/m.17048 type:complete len:161 (+) Transcript_6850:84-566(+)
MRACRTVLAALLVLAVSAFAHAGGLNTGRDGVTEKLEDISNPTVKSAYVGKFMKAKQKHIEAMREDGRKSRSSEKLKRKNRGDEVTASGHKPSEPGVSEPEKLMALLPWILPAVCVSILVIVAIGAKMCQKGNYKHTEKLREGGVKPSFKYGGPIGAGPM